MDAVRSRIRIAVPLFVAPTRQPANTLVSEASETKTRTQSPREVYTGRWIQERRGKGSRDGTYKVADDDFTALVKDGSSTLLGILVQLLSCSCAGTITSGPTCSRGSRLIYSECASTSALSDPPVARFR